MRVCSSCEGLGVSVWLAFCVTAGVVCVCVCWLFVYVCEHHLCGWAFVCDCRGDYDCDGYLIAEDINV